MADYDLIVIGSGPAGEKGAVQAAYFGKRVLLVEKRAQLGGASCNTGTLPSKTLREAALFLSGYRSRELHGVQCRIEEGLSVRALMHRERHVVGHEITRVGQNLERHGVEVLFGAAAFVDPHTVRIETAAGATIERSGDVILLAVGSRPFRPPGIPFEDTDVHDSDEVLELDRIPQSLTVVGGGVIGSEYATMFAALGVRIVLVERAPRLLEFLDHEIAARLATAMERLGVELVFNDGVERIERQGDKLSLLLKSGRELREDMILVAAGRVGNTEGLGLDRIGVATDARGRVTVDALLRTSLPHVFAAGDVIGFPSLASTAMEQARVAMCHAFDLGYKTRVHPLWPYGLYTIPEAAMVGATEEALREQGIDYEVGRARFADNARGQIVGDEDGLVKLLFRADDRRLLGAHVLGEKATELVHLGQACMRYGGTIDDFIDAVYNYPTLSEAYKYAAYDGLGRLARRARVTG